MTDAHVFHVFLRYAKRRGRLRHLNLRITIIITIIFILITIIPIIITIIIIIEVHIRIHKSSRFMVKGSVCCYREGLPRLLLDSLGFAGTDVAQSPT